MCVRAITLLAICIKMFLGSRTLLDRDILFRLSEVDYKYYGDGENGLALKLDLQLVRDLYKIPPFKGSKEEASKGSKTHKYHCLLTNTTG